MNQENREVFEDRSTILIRYGEIGLKGHNRHVFEKQLVQDIRRRLDYVKILSHRGRVFLEFDSNRMDEVSDTLKRIPGIFSFSPSVKVPSEKEALEKAVASVAKSTKHKTFKVEVRRADKSFPIKSPDLVQILGAAALKANHSLKVDVHNPELLIEVEIREQSYIFTERVKCLGGMPYGSAGRAVSLFSGGIDSPVATYLMAKRGVHIEALHFHSYPFTSPLAQEKVVDLARKVSAYTHKMKITKVNILTIQKAIKEHCPQEEMTILSRCFMMKIATEIAKKSKCSALITGESIGQVASQTMESINVTTSMTHFPVFRPLIANDKTDIIKIAQKIGTFDISILPYEDCCTVFLPPQVVTRPRLDKIQRSLSNLDVKSLVDEAIENSEWEMVSYL